MGSASASASIDRVLQAHGKRIRKQLLSEYARPAAGRSHLVQDIILSNDTYEIGIVAVLKNGQQLPLRGISIDELADRFPDCDVGY